MTRAAVFFADGFEEVEGIMVVDVLRRARFEVTMVSIMPTRRVVSSHQIPIETDCTIEDFEFEEQDILILPGGTRGMERLKTQEQLTKQLLAWNNSNRMLAAICASPSIFGALGIAKDKCVTSYPDFRDELKDSIYKEDAVVEDHNLITSRGMGTTIDFALAIVAHFAGQEKADVIAKQVIYR